MRITGGKARGITLKVPRGLRTRPAADAIREAVFSVLGERLIGSRFADLFAGTGAYGLEAWSRGAIGGTFLETDLHGIHCIRENALRVGKSGGLEATQVAVVRSDVFKWRGFDAGAFDIVFADPPYSGFPGLEKDLFALADNLLKKGGIFVLEKPASLELKAEGWIPMKQVGKKKGPAPSVVLWSRGQT